MSIKRPLEQETLDAVKQEAVNELCRNDFYFFVRYAFKKRKKFKWGRNWHHKVICDKLEAVYRGEITRLIINIPPRYSKSEIAVICFIAWCFGKNPDCEFIHSSYSKSLASKNSGLIRDIMEQPWYTAIFPAVELRNDSRAKDNWQTTSDGCMYATGNEGSITGFGAGKKCGDFGGAIVVDDPIKPKDASSHTGVGLTNVNEWFGETLESRTNDPKTPIIIIMQRLHQNDLCGFLLDGGNGETWEHLVIPAINEAGEALYPEKHTIEALRLMESSKPYVFAGQYMQRPAPKGGGIFKDDWWQYYKVLPEIEYSFIVADTAMKAKQANDYTVLACWGVCRKGRAYLIDLKRGKWEAPELLKTFIAFWNKNKHNSSIRLRQAFVEDKSSGTGLIQQIKRDYSIPIVGLQRGKGEDKVSRANGVVSNVEAGLVYIPEGAHYISDFVGEHSVFPNGTHDDMVDTTSDALEKIFNKVREYKIRVM